MLFTLDRYEFYIQQQRMARRRNWDHQSFTFETAYALNNFYLLAYAALDQVALVANSILDLRIEEHRVGFSAKVFRKVLQKAHPEIAQLMDTENAKTLVETLDLLRNHAAHRGALVPTTIYEAPETEPTEEELDAKVRELGFNEDFETLPAGQLRDSGQQLARIKARLEIYSVAINGVLILDRKGTRYVVNPSPIRDSGFLLEVVTNVLGALAEGTETPTE